MVQQKRAFKERLVKSSSTRKHISAFCKMLLQCTVFSIGNSMNQVQDGKMIGVLPGKWILERDFGMHVSIARPDYKRMRKETGEEDARFRPKMLQSSKLKYRIGFLVTLVGDDLVNICRLVAPVIFMKN